MKLWTGSRTGLVLWIAGALLWPASRAWAIAGAGDTTVIIDDLTDMWKWPREFEQWTTLIAGVKDQVQRTDELIKIAGNPDQIVQGLIKSVPDLMKPVDDAVGLETRLHALQVAQSLYGLDSVARQTYSDFNQVAGTYEAFGEKIKRDPKRYARFALQEAMNARYKRAAEFQDVADQKEAEVQREALEALKTAHTETEVAVFNARIAASKQRQDLAHQKAVQAKGELDAFNGQLLVEDARKAEANREWAQTVVDRMRDKALTAYKAQFAATGSNSSQ